MLITNRNRLKIKTAYVTFAFNVQIKLQNPSKITSFFFESQMHFLNISALFNKVKINL